MIQVGIYYAYWTHNWDADFHLFIDKAAKLGFDVLEVNGGTIANMTSENRRELKRSAEDKGIALSFLSAFHPSTRSPPETQQSVRRA